MKISIITVAFNAEKTINRTISSVRSQSYQNIEYIVIEGLSSDRTLQIIKGRKNEIDILVSEPDNGVYDAMNKGIALASGDIVGFLNADDFYANDNILNEVANTFEDKDIAICYGDLVYISPDDPNKIVRFWRSKHFKEGLFERGWMPAHPTFYARREVYKKYGMFDLSFPRQADYDLTMRFLCIHQLPFRYIPKIFVKMSTGGISNNSIIGMIKGNIEAYYSCKKNGLKVPIIPVFIFRKIMSRIPQFIFRNRAS